MGRMSEDLPYDSLIEEGLDDSSLFTDLTTRSCSKAEIESLMSEFINERLERMDSGTLFILLKQLKYAAE